MTPLATMLDDVRAVTAADVPTMVALSEKERTEREKLEPEFFRKAEQGATAQEAYFKWQQRVLMRNALAAAASFTIVLALKGSLVAAAMQGHFRCGITDYIWPSSLEDAPTATGSAVMEFDSDGNGRFTTGSLSEHLADDTRTFGEKVCAFQLVNGEYHMNSASAGTSNVAWRLKVGSDSHCGAWLRDANAPNIGYVENPHDYDTVANTGSFFLLPNGSSRWISASQIGVAIGVCSQVH